MGRWPGNVDEEREQSEEKSGREGEMEDGREWDICSAMGSVPFISFVHSEQTFR